MGLDYYSILKVSRKATTNEIKLAYRKCALKLVPNKKRYLQHLQDLVLDVDSYLYTEDILTWNLINEALDVLSNPVYRAVFDIYGEDGLKNGVPIPNGYIQPYVYHEDNFKTYSNIFGTASPFVYFIDAVTNPPRLYTIDSRTGVRVKDNTVERLLYLDLKEIYMGAIKKIKILRQEYIDVSLTKTELHEKILNLPIAPGLPSGTKIRFEEMGDQAPRNIPADIIFTVTDKPHEQFTRKDIDLYMTHKITLMESLSGFVINLKTLDDRRIIIPITDVVTNNYIKIVENEGMPIIGETCKKGNLIIDFIIDTKLNPECLEKFAKLLTDCEE